MLFSFFSPKYNISNPLRKYFILLYSTANPHKPTTLCGFVVSLYRLKDKAAIIGMQGVPQLVLSLAPEKGTTSLRLCAY